MFGRFFLVFPSLTAKQRARSYVGITKLFVVLYLKGAVFQQLLDKIGSLATACLGPSERSAPC